MKILTNEIEKLRNNKIIINKSFNIFKNKYIRYAKTHKDLVSNRKINKLIDESIKEVNPEQKEEKILNDFYDMLLGMFLTIQDFDLIEKNINVLLNNN